MVCGSPASRARSSDRRVVAATPAHARDADRIATGSASRATRFRSVLHAVAGASGWLLLAALWLWQIEAHHVPRHWFGTVSVIALSAGGLACFCALWIRWNRRIYRARHMRTTPVFRHVQFDVDALGREIVAAPDARSASHVVVDVDDDTSEKHYRVQPRTQRLVA